MFYLIGLGLENDDITGKALKAIKECDSLYFENYTSVGIDLKKLSDLLDKEIIPVDREFVENKSDFILDEAKRKDVALLIQGDCLSATTHITLLEECREKKVHYKIINGISILTSVGRTGLSLYNFGKTVSIPFKRENVKVPYDVFKINHKEGMHTLFLLDLNPSENKFVSVPEALEYLLSLGMNDLLCVGCMNLGNSKEKIKTGKAKELMKEKFDEFPQCLIIPGKMHFMEEDYLKKFMI
ncbi:MAG: diphthine synthase [Nanoarchaeota archaeon]|nr:diphthine synthase [Nanoarchaeota archaeon]